MLVAINRCEILKWKINSKGILKDFVDYKFIIIAPYACLVQNQSTYRRGTIQTNNFDIGYQYREAPIRFRVKA